MKQCCAIPHNVQHVSTSGLIICCVLYLECSSLRNGHDSSPSPFSAVISNVTLSAKLFPFTLFKMYTCVHTHTHTHTQCAPVSLSSIYHYLTQYINHTGCVIICLPPLENELHEARCLIFFMHYLTFSPVCGM